MDSLSQSQSLTITEASHLDWNAIRPLFIRLYIVERKTLIAIRKIMSCQHGFNASTNQYKKKIRQWKLEKNVKAKDKRDLIAQLKSNGETPRSDQDYCLSGKTIQGRKLSRYEKNRGKTSHSGHDTGRAGQTKHRRPPSPVAEPSCQDREQAARPGRCDETFSDAKDIKSEPGLDRLNELATWLVSWLWLREWNGVMFDEMDFVGKIALWSGNLRPSDRFLNWTSKLLSKIPVGQNTVLLALLYVYRLKFRNPLIVGDPGSEYKLLVVALVLANKHSGSHVHPLRIWSSTTTIPVAELEALQEEFLKRMGYSPLIQADVWTSWFEKMRGLSRAMVQVFGDFEKPEGRHVKEQVTSRNGDFIRPSEEMPTCNRDASNKSAVQSRTAEEEKVERQPRESRHSEPRTHPSRSPRQTASPRILDGTADMPSTSEDASTGSTLLGQYGWVQFYDYSLDPYYRFDETQGLQETLFSTPKDEESPSLSPQFPRLFSPVPPQRESMFMIPDDTQASGSWSDLYQNEV